MPHSTHPFRTLVVNTVGEPGCGKTTLSFWLCQALKQAGVVVEFVPEVVKYECYTRAGRMRVSSGRFDHRYLLQQARMVRAVMGEVEVLVNDGSFEMFSFYASRRMNPVAFAAFQARVRKLIHEQHSGGGAGGCLFVAPVRVGGYEQHGRIEAVDQANAMRSDMLDHLREAFGVGVRDITSLAGREDLLGDIVDKVRALGGGRA